MILSVVFIWIRSNIIIFWIMTKTSSPYALNGIPLMVMFERLTPNAKASISKVDAASPTSE